MKSLDKMIIGTSGMLLVLLGMAVCLSEPFSRHCVKAILFLAVLRCIFNPKLLQRMKNIQTLLCGMACFVAVMFFSCVYGGMFWDATSSYRFLMHYNMFLVPAVVVLVDNLADVKRIVIGLFVGLLATDVYMIYQSYLGVFRPVSFLKGTIMLGTMLYVILIPAMLIYSIKLNCGVKEKLFYLVCTLMSIFAFVCLNTRGAWIALFPVLIFILIYYTSTTKKKLIAVFSVFVILGVGLLISPTFSNRVHSISNSSGQEQSVNERFLMWYSAICMGIEHPLLGVGMGNYESEYQNHYISPLAKEPEVRHAHNNFIQFFAENGIVGLLSYLVLEVSIFLCSWRRRKNLYGMILFTSSLALLLYSLTDYTFAGYGAMRLYWLLLGVCIMGVSLDGS